MYMQTCNCMHMRWPVQRHACMRMLDSAHSIQEYKGMSLP